MEIDAHEQMINYAHNKGWTKEEIDKLEANKKLWEEDKVKYDSDENFRQTFDAEHGGFRNRNDIEVPVTLRSKIGDLNAPTVSDWLSSRYINYSGTDGTQNWTGIGANKTVLNDIEAAIGNKRVLEVIEDI